MLRNIQKNSCSSLNGFCKKYSNSRTIQHHEATDQEEKPAGWENAKPFDAIPGPKPIPILGNLWHFFPFVGSYYGKQAHEVNISQHEEFGDIVRIKDLKIRNDIVMLFNPKDIEMVYRNEGPYPMRDILNTIKHYRLNMRPEIFKGYGGVFVVDGEKWQESRRLINPILMQPQTIKQYVAPMETVADDFIHKMKYLASLNSDAEMPKDFSNELAKWALESIAYIAFNRRLGTLDPNLDPKSDEQQFITDVINFLVYLYEIDILPSFSKYLHTPTWRNYIKTLDRMTNFIVNNLDQTVDELLEKKKIADVALNQRTIVERLLLLDKKTALGTIMDMVVGGIDTTARSMASTLYYLAAYPEVQDKLRAELVRVFPDKTSSLTNEKMEELKYMRAVIKESMRIAPVTLAAVRILPKNLVLNGYQVPKGTAVFLSQLALCWKEEYFREPKKFMPERWLRNGGMKSNDYNPWVYLPFGFGPRSCIGRRLAQLELETLLAKIIRNYKLEWPHEEMTFRMDLLYGIDKPLRLHIKAVEV